MTGVILLGLAIGLPLFMLWMWNEEDPHVR